LQKSDLKKINIGVTKASNECREAQCCYQHSKKSFIEIS